MVIYAWGGGGRGVQSGGAGLCAGLKAPGTETVEKIRRLGTRLECSHEGPGWVFPVLSAAGLVKESSTEQTAELTGKCDQLIVKFTGATRS